MYFGVLFLIPGSSEYIVDKCECVGIVFSDRYVYNLDSICFCLGFPAVNTLPNREKTCKRGKSLSDECPSGQKGRKIRSKFVQVYYSWFSRFGIFSK